MPRRTRERPQRTISIIPTSVCSAVLLRRGTTCLSCMSQRETASAGMKTAFSIAVLWRISILCGTAQELLSPAGASSCRHTVMYRAKKRHMDGKRHVGDAPHGLWTARRAFSMCSRRSTERHRNMRTSWSRTSTSLRNSR